MNSKKLQNFSFLALLLGATAVFLWMLSPYLMPVFWAIVIAIIFHPIYKWLVKITKGLKSISSAATILIAITVITVPLITVSGLVVKESLSIYQSVSNGITDKVVEDLIFRINGHLPGDVDVLFIEAKVRESATYIASVVGSSILQYSHVTFSFLIKLIITLYLLFFMFKYDKVILNKTLEYMPINEKHLKTLFDRFYNTTQAIMRGTITIAILQGTLGGLILWMVGIPAPVLWGVVMTVLSVIPAVGPSFVMIPSGIILILSGSVLPGILVICVGMALVALVDEFLRPILIGRQSKIPDAFVLLATLGGIATFGVSGFVIGPILAAFCLSLWKIFSEEYKENEKSKKIVKAG